MHDIEAEFAKFDPDQPASWLDPSREGNAPLADSEASASFSISRHLGQTGRGCLPLDATRLQEIRAKNMGATLGRQIWSTLHDLDQAKIERP